MRLQVRGLAVDFLADVADVLAFRARRVVDEVRRLIETVGTTAAFAASRDRPEQTGGMFVDTPPFVGRLLAGRVGRRRRGENSGQRMRMERRGGHERELCLEELEGFVPEDGLRVKTIQR